MAQFCIRCGSPIIGKSKTALYRSPLCKKEAEVARRKAKDQPRFNICEKCGKQFTPKLFGEGRRYCFECVPDGMADGSHTRQIIKKWALEYKGTKCSRCGYDKCIEALEFHHRDMTQKEFSISDRNIKLEWEPIRQELDKCDLLCCNCHREIHAAAKFKTLIEGENHA